MKNKLLLLVSFAFVIASATHGQDNTELFKVLASKGANKYIALGSNEEKPLLIGKKLYKGDRISIAENAYLGLAHKSGKTIELKTAGAFEISKLASEVISQNSSLGKKYVDFVVGEMTAKDEDMTKNRHKYMAVTGSVERGVHEINLIVPDKAIENFVLAKPTVIRWNVTPGIKTYQINVDNMFDDSLFQTQTSDTSIVLDLGKLNQKNESTLNILRISAKEKKDQKAEDFQLKYIGGEKGVKLQKEIGDLKTELGSESALNKIVLASFYEEHKLFLDAMESYEQAIKQQPDVEDYKVVYGQFLLRTGIAKQIPK